MAGAMSNSVNTVAVQLALRAGVKNVARLGTDMGIASPIPNEPAIALGAVDASLLDMVMAYSTLANRGNRPERLHYLDRIETADGELIVAFKRPSDRKQVKVLRNDHADMMLHIMQQVIDRGTGSRLRGEFGITGTLMGKTGTTQEQGDGWFMGFNSRLVTGVWIGAEQSGIHFRTLSNGQAARTALPVFGTYLSRVYQNNAFKSIRTAGYPAPTDTVRALLDCPNFLPELPIFDDEYGDEPIADDMEEWNKTVAAMDEATLRALMEEFPRRDEESLGRYARRLQRKHNRAERKEDIQGLKEEDWESIFFSKKKEQ
jgi:penicillin-binding protein 1A